VEEYLAYVLAAGAVLLLAAWVWLLIAAFRRHPLWGFGCLFVPPLLLVFALCNWRQARGPVGLALFGAVVLVAPFAVNRVQQHFIDYGPRDKVVDGEQHVTLTGWDRPPAEYAGLRGRPAVVVLQMANPDVTDDTLDYLDGMTKLRELDLTDTQVTDRGLAKLAGIGTLEDLRLKNTAITDEGFRAHLMPLESLRRLDLTGTKVTGATAREWKAAKPDRRVMR
jgi:Leucine Rich repeat